MATSKIGLGAYLYTHI